MSEAEFQERLKHWREVALILRQNVVQGRKIEKQENQAKVTESKEQAEGTTGEDGTVWSTYLIAKPLFHVRRRKLSRINDSCSLCSLRIIEY